MKLLEQVLPMEHIDLDVEVSCKKRLFEHIGKLLENKQQLPAGEIFDCLNARERLGTTGLGQGVAIPHGRCAAVEKATGVFFRLKEAIDFDAPDGKPVSLVFVLLVPEQATGEHLELLAHLAERFSEKEIRESLSTALHPEIVRQLLVD